MSVWKILELACRASGLTADQAANALNDGVVEQLLTDKYGVAVDDYIAIVQDLMPFIPRVKSTFDGDAFHVFADPETGMPIVMVKAS